MTKDKWFSLWLQVDQSMTQYFFVLIVFCEMAHFDPCQEENSG